MSCFTALVISSTALETTSGSFEFGHDCVFFHFPLHRWGGYGVATETSPWHVNSEQRTKHRFVSSDFSVKIISDKLFINWLLPIICLWMEDRNKEADMMAGGEKLFTCACWQIWLSNKTGIPNLIVFVLLVLAQRGVSGLPLPFQFLSV